MRKPKLSQKHLLKGKKLDWRYALPLVAVVVLVGIYVIYRSFASTAPISCAATSPNAADLERCLTTSDEAQITRIYYGTLKRPPDAAGLRFWVTKLDEGMSINTIANGFINSPEFRSTYGSLNDQQFVTEVYKNILGRNAASSEISYWVRELEQRRKTRSSLTTFFTQSPEARISYKTRVAQVLNIPFGRVGTLVKTYSANDIVCYGKPQTVQGGRRECALEPKQNEASATREKAFIAGGANWGSDLSGPKKGLAYTVCADVRAGAAPSGGTDVRASLPLSGTTSNGPTPRLLTRAMVAYKAPIAANPTGKVWVGTATERPRFANSSAHSNFRTVCHDVREIGPSSFGWYFQLGLSSNTTSSSPAPAGTVAFAMDNIRLYQIDTNYVSAQRQTNNQQQLVVHQTTDATVPMRPEVAVLPRAHAVNATPWEAQGSSNYAPYLRVSSEDTQPVWQSTHPKGFAGENRLTRLKYSPLGTSSTEIEVEYIVRAGGQRIPIDRFVIIDFYNKEVGRAKVDPNNRSKVLLKPPDATDLGQLNVNVTPVFKLPTDMSNITVEVRLHKGHIDLGEGMRLEKYDRVGPTWSTLNINLLPPEFARKPGIALDEPPPGPHQPSHCTGTFTPGAASLRAFIDQYWPAVPEIGGYYCRPITGGIETSVHGVGRALDVYIGDRNDTVPPQPDELALGNEIRNLVYNNAETLGLQRIIWNGKIWSTDQDGWRDYTGENPHHGHLHLEINLQAAANAYLTGVTP